MEPARAGRIDGLAVCVAVKIPSHHRDNLYVCPPATAPLLDVCGGMEPISSVKLYQSHYPSSMSPPTTRRQRNSAAAADDDDNDDRWSYYISYYDLHRVPKVMRVKPGAGKEESARKWTYSTCPPVPATLKIFVFHCQPNHSAIHCLLPFPLVSLVGLVSGSMTPLLRVATSIKVWFRFSRHPSHWPT